MNDNNKTKNNAWLGIVLVVLGSYFVLRNLHIIPYSIYNILPYEFFSWRTVLIVIGVAMLSTGKKNGYIFIGIGAITLIPHIFSGVYWLQFDLRDLWPLILIAIGVSIFLKKKDSRIGGSFSKAGVQDDEYIEEVNIFGGSERYITSRNFKGGKVTSIFGGSNINFIDADLSPDNAVIDAFSLFGGCTFIVPSDWNVVIDSTNIFGGYTNKRHFHSVESPINQEKVLVIKGTAIFGGGEIKRV